MTPKFFMLIGLPASGKSTYSIRLALQENANIHSSDLIREELFNDVNNQDNNDKVFAELNRRVRDNLKNGKNVILDATNISCKRRMTFLQQELRMRYVNCEKNCVLIATPYQQCLEQNKLRDRVVPEHVIKRMYLNMEVPSYFEGWDNIYISYNHKRRYDEQKLFSHLDTIDQCNQHHKWTIGIHCKSAVAHLCSKLIEHSLKTDDNLILATLLHDIGKEFTMGFKNKKGEDTEHAHFYEHHNVSAYEALFYLAERNLPTISILDVCQLIRLHMQPFFMGESEKAKTKFINMVGQEFYDRLMLLHEADKLAH